MEGMGERKFKIGDRVVRINKPNGLLPVGATGVVVKERYQVPGNDNWWVDVEWDNPEYRRGPYVRMSLEMNLALEEPAEPAVVEQPVERRAPVEEPVEPLERPVRTVLPADSAARKAIPLVSGVLDYFPAALAEVAKVSKAGNEQHHPGQPLHWERGKSADHADTIMRHLVDRGTFDSDGQRHSAKVAWRALALLQEELEAEGAPKARGAR